jgi:hypothetical protein
MSVITSACPTCGLVAERETYDIGSGPELSCVNCEWCWGAEGQDLKPVYPPCPYCGHHTLFRPEGWAPGYPIECANPLCETNTGGTNEGR